ncbi:GT2 family glycosyltransferase [Azospirillum sp. OGB3]|uniref:glycosyltransferase family 2 protein n=1 Tax=Azospirillum sp. OGB3 TaxID=2587012 RepID=UPI001605CF7C|nr:glycosyltransferase [Azospirillum sp. OGB3]MBB3268229.1 GT2 family glycosyltransferase [Azospirillum sp. OGB3]
MKCYIENVGYDGLLNLRGWLFDPERPIARIEVCSTGPLGSDVRAATWGFVRNDVFEGNGRCEAALKSGLHVLGLQVGTQAQIDLRVIFEDGTATELPLALFTHDETATHPDKAFSLTPLAPVITSGLSVGRAGGHDLADVVGRFGAARPPSGAGAAAEPVNVLVSVYKGLHFLAPFFESIFADPGFPFELTVVDNGNDDPAVIGLLAEVWKRHRPQMRLVRVEKNEGYIKGISAAYEAATPGRHVVVLNTDLVLPPRWLERLMQPILENDDVATVTPFTNAGASCSFPIVGEDNLRFRDLPVDVIDRAFQDIGWEGGGLTLPSGVGFCMAHNKAALEKIGYYDAEAFGFGYGEENDWCLKAHRLGYRNILLPNMHVWHKHGGVYLAEEKRELIARNLRTINARYPEYEGMVHSYFSKDELFGLRTIIAARLVSTQLKAPARAIVADLAAPSAKAAQREKIELCEQGGACVWITPSGEHSLQVSVFVEETAASFHTSSAEALLALFRLLDIREMGVYSLIPNGVLAEALRLLAGRPAEERVKLHVRLGDYALFCPTRTLIDHSGSFCGLRNDAACQSCLSRNELKDSGPAGDVSIEDWRRQWAPYVELATTMSVEAGCSRLLVEDGLRRFFLGPRRPAGKGLPHSPAIQPVPLSA